MLCLRSLGGAFKRTDQGGWAHVLCAEYVREVAFQDDVLREPVIGTLKALQERAKIVSRTSHRFRGLSCGLMNPVSAWPDQKRACVICKVKGGAPVQCAETKCCIPFHVTCAHDRGWLESMAQEGPMVLPDRGIIGRGWCDKHRPVCLSHGF